VTTLIILAGINRDNAIRELIPSHSSVVEWLALWGALLLVTLLVFVWAVCFRPQSRRRHSHRDRLKPAPNAVSELAHGERPFWRARRKYHRRMERRPRNPTLAEVGGLPPLRIEKQPPAPA
jgi:hypothetical protein